jgi:Bifunctional DNA primase/polymerase, N-terminal
MARRGKLPGRAANEMATLRHLAYFLREQYPSDILMPLVPGEKRPLFAHKAGASSGAWTWDAWNQWFSSLPFSSLSSSTSVTSTSASTSTLDIGILLQELCVVDVDDDATAEQLEAEFPILAEVPMERTLHGRHYFFERSPLADLHGYYDARRPRHPNVDFKSVCRTGTAGVIAVTPSPNKSWVRAPWEVGYLISIPNSLLERVASPSHVPRTVRITFVDDVPGIPTKPSPSPSPSVSLSTFVPTSTSTSTYTSTSQSLPQKPAIEISCTWLDQVAYFAPFLEEDGFNINIIAKDDDINIIAKDNGDDDNDDDDVKKNPRNNGEARLAEIMVPNMTLETFKQLWTICESRLPGKILSYGEVAKVEAAADFLGVPPKYLSCIRAPFGALYRFADLASVSPAWGEAALSDAHARRRIQYNMIDNNNNVDEPNVGLVRLTPSVCTAVKFKPEVCPDMDSRWLFHTLPRRKVPSSTTTLLVPDPARAAEARLPRFVKDILKAFPEEIILAGGSALDLLCLAVIHDECMDYDMFICTLDEQRANAILAHALGQPGVQVGCITGTAASLQVDGLLVQIVLRLCCDMAHVLHAFDLSVCKACIVWEKHENRKEDTIDEENKEEEKAGKKYDKGRQRQQDGGFVAWASPSWVTCIEAMACWLPVDLSTFWSRSSAMRAFKYYAKGFDIFIPGVRRAAMVTMEPKLYQVMNLEGIAVLFGIEAHMLKTRRVATALTTTTNPNNINNNNVNGAMTTTTTVSMEAAPRLTPKEVRQFAYLTRKARGWAVSDYSIMQKLAGRLSHGIHHIVDKLMHCMITTSPPLTNPVGSGGGGSIMLPFYLRGAKPLTLEVVNNGGVAWVRSLDGPFRPCSPRWDLLYKDTELLSAFMVSLITNLPDNDDVVDDDQKVA